MRISQSAFDLIVREEVSSESAYNKKYRHPEWPGASSGATVGIGYDLGQTSKTQIKADWEGRVTPAMLDAMMSASGKTGTAGRTATKAIKNKIDIPWATAIAVHRERVLPRWEAKVAKALPNTDKLSADSFGALVSLTFNRGPSFSSRGARYAEMRAIKRHMGNGEFAKIPDEIRAMKRLWDATKLAGLHRRRDAEADLFERGLSEAVTAPHTEQTDGVSYIRGKRYLEIEGVQRALLEMGYSVGEIDGKWGGMTKGAIAAFKNDRHMDGTATIDESIKAELQRAAEEGWRRPITEKRKDATADELAPKLPDVAASKKAERVGFWASIGAFLTTITTAIVNTLGDAVEWITPLRNFGGDVPGWVWIVAALAGSLAIFYVSRKAGQAKDASVEAYREGART